EGILALGHLGFLVAVRNDLGVDGTLLGLAGDDTRTFVLALLEQVGVAGHDEAALGPRWLVAALAMLLEDGADLAVVSDLVGFRRLLRRRVARVQGRPRQQQQGGGKEQTSKHGHWGVPRGVA